MVKILNTYLYGSKVYGTDDEHSDVDYIVVTDYQKERESQHFAGFSDITAYPAEYFQRLVDDHVVSALECIFLPEKFKIELVSPSFKLDLEKLRRSFSAKSSNSWVKASKKIELHDEHRVGRKSLFHSMRILIFGTQIATDGCITNYQAANWIWSDIQKQNFMCWDQYKKHWKPIYNDIHSKFKTMAPLK